MPTRRPLATALRRHRLSALAARRAAREASKARPRGVGAVAGVVVAHQVAQARMGEAAVAEMLAEQAIDAAAEALLRAVNFTTDPGRLAAMLEPIPQDAAFEFERLVESLVQDAGRAAEVVAVATRPGLGWVRQLTPPSCSRCVVLAGRVYRYSDGFLRHPQDDCITVPVRAGDSSRAVDVAELVRAGQVSNLSKADREAILDGADLGRVINVRRRAAGLTEAGTVLARAGRPTPAGIYRMASDRTEALTLLERYGYIT